MFEGVGLFWHRNGFSWINSVVTNLWDLARRSSEFRWTVANSLVTMHHTPASILTHLFLASGSLTVFTWHKKLLHWFLNHLISIRVCIYIYKIKKFDDKWIQMQLFWNSHSLTLDSCSQHGLATAWLMLVWTGNVILFQNRLLFTCTLSQYDAGSHCQITKTVNEGRERMYTLFIFGFPGSRVILFHLSIRQWLGKKEKVVSFRFLWPCIVSEVWRERKNQQDATIICLLLTSVSTCFGNHYAHLQENTDRVTAFGLLLCNKWENVDISHDVFFVG